jgi:hypothetical protein
MTDVHAQTDAAVWPPQCARLVKCTGQMNREAAALRTTEVHLAVAKTFHAAAIPSDHIAK